MPEPAPSDLEVRRDALLLRIAELRDRIQQTDLDPKIVSNELSELDTRLQKVQGLKDITLFEEILDTLEKITDSRLK